MNKAEYIPPSPQRRHCCEKCGEVFICKTCTEIFLYARKRQKRGDGSVLYDMRHAPKRNYRSLEPWYCQKCVQL
jgi:hypothetical protein